MQDSVTCICMQDASLYYEYGMMLCINTPAPELRDVISAGRRGEGKGSDFMLSALKNNTCYMII
jgi:hypothetical protein